MLLPQPCGPLTEVVISGARNPESADLLPRLPDVASPLHDADFQLGLWVLYELHYRSFDDAHDEAEWSPSLLAVRRQLELTFDAAVERECAPVMGSLLRVAPKEFPDQLFELTETFGGPAVAEYVQRRADREQIRELLVHRSVYHLKEADPYSFAIPRLAGGAKAALVELQYDEYGDGRADRVHQDLFAAALRAADLDPNYGAYVSLAPAEVLVLSNVMTLFCLHRSRRAAAMGHLAAFEATSSVPCRRYAAGIRRVGLGDDVARYFDEHVEADAVHEQLAVRGICGALLELEPALQRDLAIGATACLVLDAQAGAPLLEAWKRGTHLVDPTMLDAPVGKLEPSR